MTPEQLKASILQYAIQGKLVEQRPEEGTAEDLLKSIQEEKQKLIKEGKIKKEKPLAEITDDEIPFDIPSTWKWCYLGEIFTHTAGKALNAKNTIGEKHKYITTSNVYWDHFELDNLKEMYYTEDEIEKYSVQYGDLLVLEGGDVGRTAIWNLHTSYCIQNHIHRLRPYTEVNIRYFYYVMMYLKFRGDIAGKGIGIKGLSANALHCINIPLPPLAEQHRIVAKIEELMPFVDRYAASYEQLEQLNTKFPGDMKKSILQYAIQGKLVEQRPEEGTAEELYQQIQEEKQKLIKEGKIKKEKPLPEITEDEIPFDIPESWKWVRLRNICTKIVDGDHNPPAGIKEPTEYVMLSATNINKNTIVDLDKVRYLTKEDFIIENQRTKVKINDIFFTIVGSMGRSCVYKGGLNVCFQRSVSVLTTLIYPEYLKYMLDSPFVQSFMYINSTGTAQKGFYLKQLENLIVALPPLAEQHRIVTKLEELLPYCDRLE